MYTKCNKCACIQKLVNCDCFLIVVLFYFFCFKFPVLREYLLLKSGRNIHELLHLGNYALFDLSKYRSGCTTAISRNNIHSNLSVGFPLGNFFVRFNAYALRNGCNWPNFQTGLSVDTFWYQFPTGRSHSGLLGRLFYARFTGIWV